MEFVVKKKENCFADAENYSYSFEAGEKDIVAALRANADTSELRINTELRRPTFIARLSYGPRIKGLIEKNNIRVGYDPQELEEQKARFEAWLFAL